MHSETIRLRKPDVGFRTAVRAGEKRETADEEWCFKPDIILRAGSDVVSEEGAMVYQELGTRGGFRLALYIGLRFASKNVCSMAQ